MLYFADDLIYKLVPADIAKKLKNHITVTPEIYDSVSGRSRDFTKLPLRLGKHYIANMYSRAQISPC